MRGLRISWLTVQFNQTRSKPGRAKLLLSRGIGYTHRLSGSAGASPSRMRRICGTLLGPVTGIWLSEEEIPSPQTPLPARPGRGTSCAHLNGGNQFPTACSGSIFVICFLAPTTESDGGTGALWGADGGGAFVPSRVSRQSLKIFCMIRLPRGLIVLT